MLATDAADTVKVLKEKISVFNMAPEHISITNAPGRTAYG